MEENKGLEQVVKRLADLGKAVQAQQKIIELRPATQMSQKDFNSLLRKEFPRIQFCENTLTGKDGKIMGKKRKNQLQQFEKFLVCPGCKRPFFRKSALKIKGAGRGYGFCGHCGFELHRVFEGAPAGEGISIPDSVEPKERLGLDVY